MVKFLNKLIDFFRPAKTGYEYLSEMCLLRNEFNSFHPWANPITKRVEYIISALGKLNVNCAIDTFNAYDPEKTDEDALKYVNVYSFFGSHKKNNDTILFLAHHDIVQTKGENCQDNTSSVCNLLYLCSLIKGEKLNKNILIAFTDAEEIASKSRGGAKRLANLIKTGRFGNVIKSINLELTANGDSLYVSSKYNHKLMNELTVTYGGSKVNVPYNDNVCLEANGINGVCMGILSKDDFHDVLVRGMCDTWELCHEMDDTIENANRCEMKTFVDEILFDIAING